MASDNEIRLSRDLRAYGVSARMEARRVASGLWVRPVPGVVASGPCDLVDLARAALLRAGPDATLSHHSGAQILLDRDLSGVVQVAVPHGRRVSDFERVRYHQERTWEQPTTWSGWPILQPARICAQVCAADDLDEADRRALVTGLVQRRRVTADAVADAARTSARRRLPQVRRLVEEVLAGAHSGPEAALWRA